MTGVATKAGYQKNRYFLEAVSKYKNVKKAGILDSCLLRPVIF